LQDFFGYSVAASGNTVAVSAIGNTGRTYVFLRSGNAWTQQQLLYAGGRSTAVSADTLVAGAVGGAFIFDRSGGVWAQHAYLKAVNNTTGKDDNFGISVAVSGGTVAVGADLDNAAYIYDRSTPNAYLKAPSAGSYGYSVSVSGDTTVVGAPAESGSIGAVYVYAVAPAAAEVTILNNALPVGTAGDEYVAQLSAIGGKPPYGVWALASGTVPPGVIPNAPSGVISGFPIASGTFNFSVTVKDSTGVSSAPQAFAIRVLDPLRVLTKALPAAIQGTPYNFQLSATGGLPPYTGWTIISGTLPAGVTIAGNGVISGTPVPAGSSTVAFTVKDSRGVTSPAQPLTVVVNAALPDPFAPTISPGGIVPIYSSTGIIQAGEWVSLFGTNLATKITTWNGDFPTSLGSTSVTVNGKPAYLWFVSPGQINMQVPDDATTGNVPVVVTTPGGKATATVTVARLAPALMRLDATHVTGIILRSDGAYDILGPTGNALGYRTVAARPGDTVVLYAVGFGPTNPAVPAGRAFSGAARTSTDVQLLIGGRVVQPSFAGLVSAGLFQLNLTIPTGLGSGELPVQALVDGTATPPGRCWRCSELSTYKPATGRCNPETPVSHLTNNVAASSAIAVHWAA
jgi:uncharacterized protein (TIGR03437 family)